LKSSSGNTVKVRLLGALYVFVMFALCSIVQADEQGSWWSWPTVDGNWGGYRHTLSDLGLSFSGSSINDLQGNVSGGYRKAYAFADTSLFALDIDFEKLARLQGFLFHAEFVAAAGENLSTKSIGNLFQVATAYSRRGYYLGQMYIQQKIFDDRVRLQVGRMTTANNFGSLPVFNDYVSFADNAIPASVSSNTVFFTSIPGVEWAAAATVAPTDSILLAAGTYNTNMPSALPVGSRHGVDFSFDGSGGPMEVGQIAYNLNQGSDDEGLPGTYYLGGFYSGATYNSLSGGRSERGNYGFYFEAQQVAYRNGGPNSAIGLTPWLAVSYNPQQNIDRLPLFVSGGAVYQGLISGRGDDTSAIAWYYGKLSTAVPAVSGEKVLELNYTWWATPWLGVTPDFQYVFNPSGNSSSNDAAVLGAQFLMLF
jgi:porin